MSSKTKTTLVCGVPLTLLIGVLACFGDDAVGASINSAFASIAQAFPDVPYDQVVWLYSMPKIVIVPVTFFSGFIVGKRVSYRIAAIVGFALIGFGGIAPVMLNDFWAIMATRFVMGIGLGIQAPIGPALVMQFFHDQNERSKVLGYGHAFINIYGVITNLLVGYLCAIGWRYAFLAYGSILILLVIAIACLRNPENEHSPLKVGASSQSALDLMAIEAGGKAVQRENWIRQLKDVPKGVYGLCFAYLITLVFWGVAGLNLSAVIASRSLGDPATAGILLSLINVSGMVAGFAFGKLHELLKHYTLAAGYFIMVAGFACYFFASNIIVLAVGIFIAGLANTILITGFEATVGARCNVDQAALGMSLCMAVNQLAGFFSGFYLSFVMVGMGLSSYEAPVGVSAILLGIMGVCFLAVGSVCKKREAGR